MRGKVFSGLILLAVACTLSVPLMAAGGGLPEIRQEPVADTTYGCLICHAEKRRSFTMGIHSERGIRCSDCHGGNSAEYEAGPAHAGEFLGDHSKLETIELCSSCHSDGDEMRQYGLPADQLAEFRTSRHGSLLLDQGNTDAPTCTDCHDAHTILPPEDARSNVFPANIPTTCAHCHEDVQLMAQYGLSTDQYSDYRQSAHGVSLFEEQNVGAPTCTGCHGSHAALPPGVVEVVNVCDRCHVLVGRAFSQGPHGEASGGSVLPAGCLGCHSNHGTEHIPSEQITDVCATCHTSGGRPSEVAAHLQEVVGQATGDLELAELAIAELSLSGAQVTEERFRYQSALTSYEQLALVQHSMDLELLDELARGVRSNSELIHASAEARAEVQWEHKLLLIPIWFLALSAAALAGFKLRDLRTKKQ